MGSQPTERSVELWQVQLGNAGCLMRREELDAALARDDIDANTLVREPGTLGWRSFGAATGIESDTMILTSSEVEIVPADYEASVMAPRPVALYTRCDGDPLTKVELSAVQPRSLMPRLFLVATAALVATLAFADRTVPAAKAIVGTATSAIRSFAAAPPKSAPAPAAPVVVSAPAVTVPPPRPVEPVANAPTAPASLPPLPAPRPTMTPTTAARATKPRAAAPAPPVRATAAGKTAKTAKATKAAPKVTAPARKSTATAKNDHRR
jgi:hypothetical protein